MMNPAHVTQLGIVLVEIMLGVACYRGLCFESQLRDVAEMEALKG